MKNRIILLVLELLLFDISMAQIIGEVRINPEEVLVSPKDGYDEIIWL